MGVTGLLGLLKCIENASVSLEDGGPPQRHVIIDGGFLLHFVANRGNAAHLLVLNNDVSGFVRECANVVGRFELRGIHVTVVFGGVAPPAKQQTGDRRRQKREEKAIEAKTADAASEPRAKVNALAAQACSFGVRTKRPRRTRGQEAALPCVGNARRAGRKVRQLRRRFQPACTRFQPRLQPKRLSQSTARPPEAT